MLKVVYICASKSQVCTELNVAGVQASIRAQRLEVQIARLEAVVAQQRSEVNSVLHRCSHAEAVLRKETQQQIERERELSREFYAKAEEAAYNKGLAEGLQRQLGAATPNYQPPYYGPQPT